MDKNVNYLKKNNNKVLKTISGISHCIILYMLNHKTSFCQTHYRMCIIVE